MPSSATLQTSCSPQIPLSLPSSLADFFSETLAWFYFVIDNNVWFGATAENQQYFDARWPAMLKLRERFPDAPLWISYEPALGPISLAGYDDKPDWIIFGGETGAGFRPTDAAWARSIMAECEQFGISFFFKQMAAGNTSKAKGLIPADMLIRNYLATQGKLVAA